jgi:hypothetical protein
VRIRVEDFDSLSPEILERLKSLIKKAALLKLKQLPEERRQNNVHRRGQHIIHKAMEWKKVLENGEFKSHSQIAKLPIPRP